MAGTPTTIDTSKPLTTEEIIALGERLKQENSSPISNSDVMNLSDSMQKAKDDPTPFALVNNDVINVIGDPNKTETVKNDYVMAFRVPKTFYEEKGFTDSAEDIGEFKSFTRHYKDVTITGFTDLKIMSAMLKLQPFFMKAKEDNNGSLEYRDKTDMIHVMAVASQDIILAMYNVAAALLGIDDELGQFMYPAFVMKTLNTLFESHPEMLNEVDGFFGLSIEGL